LSLVVSIVIHAADPFVGFPFKMTFTSMIENPYYFIFVKNIFFLPEISFVNKFKLI